MSPLRSLALALWLATVPALAHATPPNFVVIVTDDQRFDSLQHMPLTLAALAARGVTFTRAFATNPVCAPSRASLLSGGFVSHSTGVVDNVLPNGGAGIFDASPSLATALQGAGYATGLFGKYLNEYSGLEIPPGWTRFEAALGIALAPTSYVVGSSTALPGTGTYSPVITQYGTDYLRDRAIDFIDQHANEPFFLYLPLAAPHTPSTPAPGDESLFPGYVYRERGYGEDTSDKPYRVQLGSSSYPAYAPTDDALHRDMLRTLQAVDRAVDAIVDHLDQNDLLANTVIVYTSDNGYLWGEHGLVGKGEAYEESVRVPLVVVAPGVGAGSDERMVAMNLDLPATVLDLAGLPHFGDGISLAPLFSNPALPGRTSTLIESSQQWHVWAGLTIDDTVGRFKYVEDASGDRELYDLDADPYELSNLAGAPEHQALIASLSAQLAPQKGLAIKPRFVPPPLPGQPYVLQLQRWGGTPPFVWSVDSGALPAGLTLDTATGEIYGTPTSNAGATAVIRVRDGSTNTQTGQPQSYGQVLSFPSAIPACSDGLDNDHDGSIDMADTGCASAGDTSEQISGLNCDDGSDNDLDGLVDLADPGCDSPYDSLETTNATECDDGVDNDGDVFVDTHDPGCLSPTDASEHADEAACDNGLDDDADGFADLFDPGCSGVADPDEITAELECDDGIDNDLDGHVDATDPACPNPTDGPEGPVCDDGDDNDGDGKVDFPVDPGCTAPWASVENPQCDDGIDNDSDTKIDWLDPQCKPGKVDREARKSQCGLGAELVLALTALRAVRRVHAGR